METTDRKNITDSLKAIRALLHKADDALFENCHYVHREDSTHYENQLIMRAYIEDAFTRTLVLLEVQGLSRTYDKLNDVFVTARTEGFDKSEMGIDDPYLVWGHIIYSFLDAIATSYHVRISTNIIEKDVISILRSSLYSITDKNLFSKPPSNEKEVHSRIEGVLRCIFPDLKHKPQLTKPIKNFEPDTGLPSVRTLIEYKFISTEKDAKLVSDQVLADSRGYISKDWDAFLYVIYETHRIKPEDKWIQHLKECGVDNAKVIVLSGEPSKKLKRKNA